MVGERPKIDVEPEGGKAMGRALEKKTYRETTWTAKDVG
jgi:hypothetical protein